MIVIYKQFIYIKNSAYNFIYKHNKLKLVLCHTNFSTSVI